MKRLISITLTMLSLTAALLFAGTASATTCTKPGDWIPAICDAEDWGSYNPQGSRCWDHSATQAQMITGCTNEAVGCNELGGCFGPNPPGHWVVTVIDGKKVRCRCGCWTEETQFASANGILTGADLVAAGEDTDGIFEVTSVDVLGGLASAPIAINGVVFGGESELVYKFTTDAGKIFTVTSAHPIVVASETGTLEAFKAAELLQVGEYVLNERGEAEKIVRLDRQAYEGRVVNFNVKSTKPGQHVVAANGILMGDNAWQQNLAATDARRLSRADILRELMVP